MVRPLTDPPGGVGRELVALAVVELLGGTYQAEGALLDQVEERQALVAVVLRNGDHKAEVALHHLLLGLKVAHLDKLGELHFLLGIEQRDATDVAQEELQEVGR